MKQSVIIIVQVPDRVKTGHFRELYRNTIFVDSSIEFPYSKILEVMRILYPLEGLVINFKIA